jgi:hypothetical protein
LVPSQLKQKIISIFERSPLQGSSKHGGEEYLYAGYDLFEPLIYARLWAADVVRGDRFFSPSDPPFR